MQRDAWRRPFEPILAKPDIGMALSLDYERLIRLDAEALAEIGILDAYERLLPELEAYLPQPAPVEEEIDCDAGRYAVRCGGKEYVVAGRECDDAVGHTWGRATFALFHIINEQLGGSDYRFYAFKGGNDLGGMLLTPAQAQAAREELPRKQDWPYLPTAEPPWYGQPH